MPGQLPAATSMLTLRQKNCTFLSVLVSVLLFASVKRFSVSRMRDFFLLKTDDLDDFTGTYYLPEILKLTHYT